MKGNDTSHREKDIELFVCAGIGESFLFFTRRDCLLGRLDSMDHEEHR